MDVSDLASSLISMQQQKTQSSVQMAVLKKQFEMQKSAIDMLMPVKAQPAPGTGTVVDMSV